MNGIANLVNCLTKARYINPAEQMREEIVSSIAVCIGTENALKLHGLVVAEAHVYDRSTEIKRLHDIERLVLMGVPQHVICTYVENFKEDKLLEIIDYGLCRVSDLQNAKEGELLL